METILARLTSSEFSTSTLKERKRMIVWLETIIEEIKTANPKDYSKRMRWTVYK